MNTDNNTLALRTLDAVVIGAGFAGLYMLYRLRELGFTVRVYEAGDGVGGTWYWNRYPGARCDSPSFHYAYSFSPELDQEWEWTEFFPSQPEILRYLNHVADRFDLRRDIQFSTRVVAAEYHEAAKRWIVQTDTGERVAANFCITAVGCLSAANLPTLPGQEHFLGAIYHTGRWPHHPVDFTGQRVGVIGTGSTGIQIIPQIAQQAAHLTVFQRTPNYSVPARNRPLTVEEKRQIKATYPQLRQECRHTHDGLSLRYRPADHSALADTPVERQDKFEEGWRQGAYVLTRQYNDLTRDLTANTYIADFVRAKIGQIVHDPAVAAMLMPRDHPFGSKRLPLDTDYYETFNRPNVTLVDLRQTPITEMTATGLCTQTAEYALDMLVFATGFDAITGPLLRLSLRGRNGLPLQTKWADGPHTYLGLQTAGFPNLFMITGPGSPSVLTNVPVSIEQHVEWIADCLAYLRTHRFVTIEPSAAAEADWTAHVNEVASQTLYPLANSWYLGSNIPGKPRIFLPYAGGVGVYRQKCDAVAANGYDGFILSA
jgi:cyclohexanone monooxygenase